MRIILHIIFLLIIITISNSCNIKKHVPENQYLLVSNQVDIPNRATVSKKELENIIRQRPNHRTLGFKLKLRVYNTIDSTKTAESKLKRYNNYRKKNKKRLQKQDRINNKRIKKALKKGKTVYLPKTFKYKDTITPKPTLRERIKYDFGEAPVIYDSLQMLVSKNQIQLLMSKKGYFNAEVTAQTNFNSAKKKAEVIYSIDPKDAYYVDSIYLRTQNKTLEKVYLSYLQNGKKILSTPFQFDSHKLKEMRNEMAEHFKNNGIYGFKDSYINFEVDTLNPNKKISVAIDISQRIVGKDGKNITRDFDYTKVGKVYFHFLDTISYKGNFAKQELLSRNIILKPYDPIPTFDTLRYYWGKDSTKRHRNATFLYNGRITASAELIEFQNYMEETNLYRSDYLTQSYNRLMSLDIFRTVQPEIVEKDSNLIDVHYYLIPHKLQTVSFEPKSTHNNSFLGVSSSLNYVNRNLFRRGYKFKVSLSGGFESQPEIFGENDEKFVLNDGTKSFNTLEFGPTVELEMPGLIPIPLRMLSKRQSPKTSISSAYNIQQRPDFDRQIFQVNYLWKFVDIYRTQVFTIGIPVIGDIRFVRINKSEELEKRLIEQNDLFLINAYSNQAIYKDLALTYSYTSPELKNGKYIFSYGINFDLAGMAMRLITKDKPYNSEGYKEIFGQRYSQFIRLDNQLVFSTFFNKENSLHSRLQIGVGVPLENNGISLPFDYSFFGGGSNDNRGYGARTLGPGAYKYYLDSNRTSTQMGDMRLGASIEYRFRISKLFEGAIFSDAGNLWTYNYDPNREAGNFTKDFYKQLSISAGMGLRLDFTFLIVRIDVGVPLRNPALPDKARWIFQSRQPYYNEAVEKWGEKPSGDEYYRSVLPNPFKPQFHIAIGYPF